jgi:hypothetical protein
VSTRAVKIAPLLIPLFMASILSCRGAKSATNDVRPIPGLGPAATPEPEMLMWAWLFPPIFGEKSDGDFSRVTPLIPTHGKHSLEILALFKENGITFPPGSEAAYMGRSHILIVRNTGKNIDAILTYLNDHPCDRIYPTIEISTVECVLPEEDNPLSSRHITYAEIEGLPAKSIKLLDRLSQTATFGQTTAAQHVIKSASMAGNPDQQTHGFGTAESGAIVQFNTSLGGDMESINTDLTYRFKRLDIARNRAIDVHFASSFVSRNDEPRILSVSPDPDTDDAFIVIICKMHLFLQGWDDQKFWRTANASK